MLLCAKASESPDLIFAIKKASGKTLIPLQTASFRYIQVYQHLIADLKSHLAFKILFYRHFLKVHIFFEQRFISR